MSSEQIEQEIKQTNYVDLLRPKAMELFNREASRVFEFKCSGNDRFPHKCPRCGGAAYIGINTVECMVECHRRLSL